MPASDFLWSQLPEFPSYFKYSSEYLISHDIPGRLNKIKSAFKTEINNAENSTDKLKKVAALSAFAGSVAWEWGPFNELVAIAPAVAIQQSTGNSIGAGIVGGSIYAAQQALFGTTTAIAISKIPETKDEYHKQFKDPEELGTKPVDDYTASNKVDTSNNKAKKITENSLLLLGLGESAVIINRHAQEKNRSFKQDAKLIGKMTAILAAVDIAVFSAGAEAINKVDSIGVEQSTAADVLTNPLTYILAFGGLQIASYYRRKYKKGKLY